MNLQNNEITRTNTRVGIIGIAIGILSLVVTIFGEEFIWGSVLIVVSFMFLFKYLKSSKPVEKPTEITQSFTVKVGHPENLGFLPQAQRRIKVKVEKHSFIYRFLARWFKARRSIQAQAGQNPYVCGPALPGNSPMFYGREEELRNILGFLQNPEQSGNISIIGERRIGKSSLLNQVCQALAVQDNVITISTTTQEWKFNSQADFFASLHQAIGAKLQTPYDANEVVNSYDAFSSFIEQQATTYRFVFFIDEFDKMLKNANFDADFFASMRNLGYDAKYNWSYVLASLKPLDKIMHHSLQESSFYNIFKPYPLGLLAEQEAVLLIQQPMQGCFADKFAQIQADILHYAGYHPAFIQIVAGEYWATCHCGSSINSDRIKEHLRPLFRDLWQHRSQKEQTYLFQIAHHETPNNQSILEKLRVRGLLDDKNQLFSRFFEQMIIDMEYNG